MSSWVGSPIVDSHMRFLNVMSRFGVMLCCASVSLWASAASADCPTGTTPCGTSFCSPDGNTCCASVGHPEDSCPNGEACNSDGSCVTSGVGNGSFSCESQQMPEYNACEEGAGQCGCADPCSVGTDCQSGCCSQGYCAFSCVCAGMGDVQRVGTSLFKSMCSATYTGGGQGGGGCSIGDSASDAIPLALVFPGLLALIRRLAARFPS